MSLYGSVSPSPTYGLSGLSCRCFLFCFATCLFFKVRFSHYFVSILWIFWLFHQYLWIFVNIRYCVRQAPDVQICNWQACRYYTSALSFTHLLHLSAFPLIRYICRSVVSAHSLDVHIYHIRSFMKSCVIGSEVSWKGPPRVHYHIIHNGSRVVKDWSRIVK